MKIKKFIKPTIAKKLAFLIFNAMLGIFLITGFLLYQEREVILKERRNSVQQAVEAAYGVLQYYETLVKKDELTIKEAQVRAIASLRGTRYGGNEYFWINDMEPRILLHPIKPELENTNVSENKDPTGKRLFVEMVNIVKENGAGFVFYMWPKPGSDLPVQKVSYVKGFTPWGWVIGSGVYLDTVQAIFWSQTKTAMLFAVALGIIMFFIGRTVARSITTPLASAIQIAQRVAQGDLTSKILVNTQDETGKLIKALKEMNENLLRIVSNVHVGTDTITTASSQIAAGNLDLSSRTELQASSLEETASAMEELTSTVKQNADNARQANQLAASASNIAIQGGIVVAQVVHTMGEINQSAKKIGDIIGVIDGIAFQTNILAVNAAVEAARAGEQGRGFAVVATEVRSLAQRSAAAAKEIKALIGNSMEKVDIGSKLVAQAGSTMNDVVDSVKRVTDIMAEISDASQEQSAGIEQVNQAIIQMDQVTQQNAALVEEAAAAASALQEQAGSMAQTVSVFKLRTNELDGLAYAAAGKRKHKHKHVTLSNNERVVTSAFTF